MPAVTFGVSTNFALAKFLASRSLGNISVALASECFLRGTSNETFHVPWDLLAVEPSRGLYRRLTAARLQPAFSWWGHRAIHPASAFVFPIMLTFAIGIEHALYVAVQKERAPDRSKALNCRWRTSGQRS